MKNLKKLILSGILLVVALVAAVSSTLAWFTMQQDASVNDMELGAASEGLDLQISTDNTNWGYVVTVASPNGALLKPTTFDASDTTFKELAFDTDATNEDKNKFEYVDTTPIIPGATTGEGYLTFDLYFKSSNENIKNLYLNITDSLLSTELENKTILNTVRMMFIVQEDETSSDLTAYNSGNTLIYEPNYEETSTYGNGAYFLQANNYIAYNAFTHTNFLFLNSEVDENGYYTLNDTFFADRKYTAKNKDNAITINDAEGGLLITNTMVANTVLKVKVCIWLEGWDGDTNNTVSLAEFAAKLKFTATDASEETSGE